MSTTVKADWKVCIKGDEGYGYEISICRESFLHGFLSYGWESKDQKIILFRLKAHSVPTPLWEVVIKFKDGPLMEFTHAAADAMNHVEQQSLLR